MLTHERHERKYAGKQLSLCPLCSMLHDLGHPLPEVCTGERSCPNPESVIKAMSFTQAKEFREIMNDYARRSDHLVQQRIRELVARYKD